MGENSLVYKFRMLQIGTKIEVSLVQLHSGICVQQNSKELGLLYWKVIGLLGVFLNITSQLPTEAQ